MHAFEVGGVEKSGRDTILEIDVLANRGHDALSHIGMAREICALENRKLVIKSSKLGTKKSKRLSVKIMDKKLCPRYIGVVMTGIKVQPSPKWMQERLVAAGLRSINNIVDATNYVMLETGQPMHAFDSAKLKAQSAKLNIIIRKAKKGEKINLLDGGEKVLSSSDLVIADSEKALAIAGIKGGAEAEINKGTNTIVLESANFNAVSIRKSRMRLGLKTDSSDRFEKEIDPNLAETAMARAIEIIGKFGGKLEGITDIYPKKFLPWKIKLDIEYVNNLLGEEISAKEVIKILNLLELKTSGKGKAITVEIPTFRLDLKTQEDLIEEIGRIYGYEKIKAEAPLAPVQTPSANERRLFEREVKNILVGKGFSEVYNYSFYSLRDASLAQLGSIQHLELENPMNPNQALLRISLIPNILENVRQNLKNFKDFRIFEIGKVYWPARNATHNVAGGADKATLPKEKNTLVGTIVVNPGNKNYKAKKMKEAESFYEIKSHVDALLDRLGIFDYYYDTFEPAPSGTPLNLWHESRSAEIKIEGKKNAIGFLGEINPLVLANFDINKRVAMFRFDMDELQEVSQSEREYAPLRKHPTVMRDISMIAEGGILVDEILGAIQKAGGNLVLDVDLFDIFDFDDGSSSYAFHIIFGADNKTLKGGEVDEAMKKIINTLEKDLGVKVRK